MSGTGTPSAAALQRWRLASALLDEALDQAPEALPAWRQALNQRLPAPDAEVLDELDQLLAAHATVHGDDPMATPPALGSRPAPKLPQGPEAGQRIGPWELVSRLGEGGMAEVWRARRADGAYDREVALKLPRQLPWRSDLGERLARERDILARLSHPHIARLYDAGVSAVEALGGAPHPWLAMELVDGAAVVEWCNARRLPLRERVQLFLQVLEAVAHAHAMLVLHRDIKPSNILVNAAGEVRLLDFGIAKLLDEEARSTTDTRLTQFGGRALTPDYASPEQLRGEPLTTASDVYSLGVVLCELLCGELPYRLRHRSAAQMEAAVLEAEPQRPSTHPGAHHAEARGLTQGRLARALRGDLDAIVLTALRKAAGQRYGGAAEFKADLQRWLDGMPVLAQPDSLPYRVARFVRRHRLGVTAATGVAAVLLATTLVSVQQSQMARREASRAQATRDFLLGLYQPLSWLNANPARGGQVTARELLDLSAEQLNRHPAADVEVQRDLLATLAHLFQDVDAKAGWLQMSQRLEAHTKVHFGADSPEHFEALVLLSDAQAQSDVQAAAETLGQARDLMPRQPGLPLESRVRYWMTRGGLSEARDAAAAEAAYNEVIRLTQDHPELGRYSGKASVALAGVRWYDQGRMQDAEGLYEQALQRLRGDPSLSALEVIQPEVELAELKSKLGHFKPARELYEHAFRLSSERLGLTNTYTLQTGWRMAELLRATGQVPEARDLIQRLLAAVAAAPAMAGDLETLPDLYREAAAVETDLGRWVEAERHFNQAWQGLAQRQGGHPNAAAVYFLSGWALAQAQLGQTAQVVETRHRIDDLLRQVAPSPRTQSHLAGLRAGLAVLALAPGHDLAPVLASIDAWAGAQAQEVKAASAAVQERSAARVDLWRAQAGLFGGQPRVALQAAQTALARMTDAVERDVGGNERARGLAAEAEARWLLGQTGPACEGALRARALLDVQLPGAPEQALMHRLAHACGQGPALSGEATSALTPPSWQRRARALEDRRVLSARPHM